MCNTIIEFREGEDVIGPIQEEFAKYAILSSNVPQIGETIIMSFGTDDEPEESTWEVADVVYTFYTEFMSDSPPQVLVIVKPKEEH